MGQWNETCMITQLPIRGGDRVVAFFIVKDSEWARHHTPVSLPIRGVASCYGEVTPDPEQLATAEFEQLDVQGRSIEDLIYGAERATGGGSPFTMEIGPIRWNREDEHNVYLCMVHEEIYDTMIGELPQNLDRQPRWDGARDKLQESLKIVFTRKLTEYSADVWRDDVKGVDLLREMAGTRRGNGVDEHTKVIANLFNFFWDGPGSLGWKRKRLKAFLTWAYALDNPDDGRKLLEELVSFDWRVTEARKTWFPQWYAGSQAEAWDIHVRLAAATIDLATRLSLEG